MLFRPCTGECSEEGTHCEGCGRSFEEIDEMRDLVNALVSLAKKREYENYADFADGVASSIKYAISGEHH